MKQRKHQSVGPEFLATAPTRVVTTQRLPVTADVAFRCLEDAGAWDEWLGIDVTWTSALGHGATRTVATPLAPTDEYFFVWEDGSRMAFRFEASGLPVKAFAEDYVLSPVGDGACDLEWTVAISGNPIARAAVGAALKGMAVRGLPKLADLLARDGARWAA